MTVPSREFDERYSDPARSCSILLDRSQRSREDGASREASPVGEGRDSVGEGIRERTRLNPERLSKQAARQQQRQQQAMQKYAFFFSFSPGAGKRFRPANFRQISRPLPPRRPLPEETAKILTLSAGGGWLGREKAVGPGEGSTN